MVGQLLNESGRFLGAFWLVRTLRSRCLQFDNSLVAGWVLGLRDDRCLGRAFDATCRARFALRVLHEHLKSRAGVTEDEAIRKVLRRSYRIRSTVFRIDCDNVQLKAKLPDVLGGIQTQHRTYRAESEVLESAEPMSSWNRLIVSQPGNGQRVVACWLDLSFQMQRFAFGHRRNAVW